VTDEPPKSLPTDIYATLRAELAQIIDDRAVSIELTERFADHERVYRIERGPTVAAQPESTGDDGKPRCSYPGCSSKRDDGSLFCADHDMPDVTVDEDGDAGDGAQGEAMAAHAATAIDLMGVDEAT